MILENNHKKVKSEMFTVTYPFKVGTRIDNQFTIIKKLRGQVLEASDDFIEKTIEEFQLYLITNLVELHSPDRYVFDLLLLGCTWRSYFDNKTASISKNPRYTFKELLSRLNLKEEKKTNNSPPEYNLKNLHQVFEWMEQEDEFQEDLPEVRMWMEFLKTMGPEKVSEHLRNIIVFADWFKASSKLIIGEKESKSERLLYYVRIIRMLE